MHLLSQVSTMSILFKTPPSDPARSTPVPQHSHARSLWRSCLGAGLRTALACAIVGCATVYSPMPVRRHLTFPAFSYVTVVLISGEATFGDTLKGAACALYATVIGTVPAALTLLMTKPAHLYVHSVVISVAASSFMVALPRSIGLLTLRIALGQTVIVYVAALQQNGEARHLLIPAHVAACTAVGAVAAVLASLVPYPRLACYEVIKKSELYTDMVLERLRLLVDAFCAKNISHRILSFSQAKTLTHGCTKLLKDINSKQASIKWERPPFLGFSETHVISKQLKRLESMELALQAIEITLASTSLRTNTCDHQLKVILSNLRDQITLKLSQGYWKEDEGENIDIELEEKNLPAFFILYCLKLLLDDGGRKVSPSDTTKETKVAPTTNPDMVSKKHESSKNTLFMSISERLLVALKCSLSLSLAVLLGVLFSKDNGYWSGLTVAITITPWRDATFKLANARAQGTALGSVYGVLGSVISQNLMEVRFLVLLPLVIFTSFLRRSHMYGDTGGTAAVITAMIVIGRRNYGSPSAFTITRLTETFIGLACSICVELVLQPLRDATMARITLSKTIRSLRQSLMNLETGNEELMQKQVDELMEHILQAEDEPNLWFSPFNTSCYRRLHCSLAKMVCLQAILGHVLELLNRDVKQEMVHGDYEQFKSSVGSSLGWFEEELEKRTLWRDTVTRRTKDPSVDDRIVGSFLQHSRDLVEKLDEEGIEMDQVVLRLGVITFCMDGLMRETWEVEKGIMELVQWENPTPLGAEKRMNELAQGENIQQHFQKRDLRGES